MAHWAEVCGLSSPIDKEYATPGIAQIMAETQVESWALRTDEVKLPAMGNFVTSASASFWIVRQGGA
ncbi:MAG: hypothetical protein AAGJ10_00250 [Bacteroidota bacterium]